jgi:mannose-1-phosphate guanylyltransferase/mannose-6-phosphate isomerase
VRALILAGGSGTRFWPLSRRARPKQLLALEGDRTLLQETVARLAPLAGADEVWVCTTRELAAEVRRQLPEVPAGQVLLEPEGRNTAPAIAWSVAAMPAAARDGVVAVLPADHRVADPAAFRDTLARAAGVVERADRVMTLGVRPTRPDTGYGYLELGEALPGDPELRRVVRFTEKPPAAAAAEFVRSGNYLWNAGIFVFRGTTLLALLAEHQPELAARIAEIAAVPARTVEIYPHLPAVSIDYALMEKLDGLGTLPLDCGWSDLGSWEALDEVLPKDAAGNACRGDVLALDAAGNLLVSATGTVAVLGVDDLVVVRTRRRGRGAAQDALAGGAADRRRARGPWPAGPALRRRPEMEASFPQVRAAR